MTLFDEIRSALANDELIGSDAEMVYRGLLEDALRLEATVQCRDGAPHYCPNCDRSFDSILKAAVGHVHSIAVAKHELDR
jgi:hypothetical protein